MFYLGLISLSSPPSCSRKEYFEVDYCYDQHEENDLIFSREIKPLIFGVFEGFNPTIIACGGRLSGKTNVIQVRFSFSWFFFLGFPWHLLIDYLSRMYG